MKFKEIKISILIAIIVFISGCSTPVKIESIQIDGENITMDINQDSTFTFTLNPKESKIEKDNIILEDNEKLELVSTSNNQITIKTKNQTGDASFYIKVDGIESNKITINIIDKKKEEEQKKAEEAKKQEEAAKVEAQRQAEETARLETQRQAEETARLEAQRQAEETARLEAEQQTQRAQESSQSDANTTTPNSATVYVTQTGSKYHSIPKCGNSKTSTLVSLDKAQAMGLGPCSKCF